MLDYTGVKCPVCGVPFQPEDDIVVCPECGAPYHRACYQKEGKCVFDDLHAQGKEWQPPEPPKAPDPAAEIKDQECPVCGTLNGHSALFCSRCGASLTGQPQAHQNQVPPYYGGSQQGSPYGGPMPFVFDPMGGVSPAEELAQGVTFGDASKVVKQNTAYYMTVFRYMKQTRRNKFSVCAFFFSGPWMLYRKMYKAGAVVTLLVFGLYLTFQCLLAFVSVPAFLQAVEALGLDQTASLSYSSPEFALVVQYMVQNTALYIQAVCPLFCLVPLLVVMIVAGVKGNKWYMEHCVRTVRMVKASRVEDDPTMTLDARGGVNVAIATCMFVCYFLLNYVVPLLL